MKARDFIGSLDEKRIVRAIAEAERQTSGEIRVYVSHKARQEAMDAARRCFDRLGMTNTRRRNGILIYFAPVVQKFAIYGDIAIHEKCGGAFWQDISAAMSEQLKMGNYTEAIIGAVQRVGAVLAQNFPSEDADKNELPDEIAGE